MKADGSSQTRLATFGTAVRPRWSPDGTKLLFISRLPGEDYSLSVMNADGSSVVQLVKDHHDGGPLDDVLGGADWSPDGSRVVVSARRCCSMTGGSIPASRGLYVMNADGTGITQITKGEQPDRHLYPDWGPTDKILFESNSRFWTVSPDGSSLTRLTLERADGMADGGNPRWSPDGSKIAFGHSTDAWVMNADGSNRVNVGGNGDQNQPAWSPDGTELTFHMVPTGSECPTPSCPYQLEIWSMKADGTARVNLTGHSANDAQPDWRAETP